MINNIEPSIEDRLKSNKNIGANLLSKTPADVRIALMISVLGLSIAGAISSTGGTYYNVIKYRFCGDPTKRSFCDKHKEPYLLVQYSGGQNRVLPDGATVLTKNLANAPYQPWSSLITGGLFGITSLLAWNLSSDRKLIDPYKKLGEIKDYELSRVRIALSVAIARIKAEQELNALKAPVTALPISPAMPIKDADEIPQWGHQLLAALASLGINCQWLNHIQSASFTRVKIISTAPFRKFSKIGDDLKISCGFAQSPFVSAQAGFIAIDIPRSDRQDVRFEDYIGTMNREKLTFPIGVSIEGKLIEADMSSPDSTTPHFLVGGTTRSGKSHLLINFICSLLHRFTPEELQIIIIDPKMVDFAMFKGHPHIKRYETSIEGSFASMKGLIVEMADRFNKLSSAGVKNWSEYRAAGYKMPWIVLIYDEFADHVADPADKKMLEGGIKRLAGMAAASGIFIVMGTQRPSADVITPLIRSNLPGRIGLRTKSDADGAIIMGRECNTNQLLGRGDLIYDSADDGFVRLQGLFLEHPKEFLDYLPVVQNTIAQARQDNENMKIDEIEKLIIRQQSSPHQGLFQMHDFNDDERSVLIRVLAAKEGSPRLIVLRLWGDLPNVPPGNADKLMRHYLSLVDDWLNQLESEGYDASNNWMVEREYN